MIFKGNLVKFARFMCSLPSLKKIKHGFQVCFVDRARHRKQDIEKIFEDKDSQNTKRSTKVAKELFADYMKEKNLREPEEKKELAQTLKTFYVEARKKDGSSYSMGSLKTLRFGLNRYFKPTRGIDIMNDVEFNEANKVFTVQCV